MHFWANLVSSEVNFVAPGVKMCVQECLQESNCVSKRVKNILHLKK